MHSRRYLLRARQCHVPDRQHLREPAGCARIEAAGAGLQPVRMPERTEHHVPKRQIRVIVPAHAACMMDVVAFRALDDIARPIWRGEVGMLEHRVEGQEQGGQQAGLRVQSRQREQHQAFGTVMQLVAGTPQLVPRMRRTGYQ